MASVALVALSWTHVILRSLPEIIKLGHELYSLFCSIKGKHHDKEAVLKAMKLLNRHQDDIDRLLQDPQQKKELLDGLTILMRCINESSGNNNNNTRPQGAYGWNTDPQQKKELLDGLTILMRRINESSGNNNNNIRPQGAYGWNTTSSGGGDCGTSFPSKSSFKGARWMECDVCRSDYNTTTKRPLILHCGHTFCRECVEALSHRGLIKCPTCRTSETRRFASIPTNTVLMPVLEDRGSQSDDDSCCGKGSGKGSYSNGDSGSGCDGLTLSHEQQLQFAILLSKQEAEVQGQAQVDRRWQEVEEEDDLMLAQALQASEVYEGSRLCAERHQSVSASAPFDLPEEESCGGASCNGSAEDERSCNGSAEDERSCNGSAEDERSCNGSAEDERSCNGSAEDERSCNGSTEDEDASVLLAYKLQQEEIAKMKRLCGNSSNDWNKEMRSFFGPSICGMDEDDNNLRHEENAMNGREQDNDEDGATYCRRMEDGDGEDGATCYRRSDIGEDEVMCNGREEVDGGKKCSNSDDDDDDLKKCRGDSFDEEGSEKKCMSLMKEGEELLLEMAIQLSLQYPQPSDPENK